MKFEDDFLFAKPTRSAYLESVERNVYWLNGDGNIHNELTELIGDKKTRQQGWEKAVYGLACNEDGSFRYKNKVGVGEFHQKVDRVFARDYGMLILGISKGDVEKSDFDKDVDVELGNSEPESADSNS